jgi:hypothetical protein
MKFGKRSQLKRQMRAVTSVLVARSREDWDVDVRQAKELSLFCSPAEA